MASALRQKHRWEFHTIGGKLMAALALMVVVPCLAMVWLCVTRQIAVTETILFFYMPLLLFSALAGYALMRHSADQVHALSRQIRMIQAGETNEPLKIPGNSDISTIAADFNALLAKLDQVKRKNQEQATQLMVYSRDLALSYQRMKQEEELRNRLGRYVGNHLVEKLMNARGGGLAATERRDVTVLFADIRSFTTIAERMTAEEVVAMLNQYFGVMVDIVFKNNGLLDKFVGDQLIAVFGLLESAGNAPENAIRTAIEMQEATEAMMKQRLLAQQELFEVGIGINTGEAIIGNIGSTNRMDYTVIGDCVNVAARLEAMAMGGEIIIGERTFLENTGAFNIQSRGEVYVKNKMEPVVCYNVLRR